MKDLHGSNDLPASRRRQGESARPAYHINAMTDEAIRATTLVAGGHVVELRADLSGAPRSMIVAVEVDGQRSWTFEEPAWQEVRFGVSADGTVPYWWSARHLFVLPVEEQGEPQMMSVDEDVHFVFSLAEGWLLICESSVRLLVEQQEVSRLETGEVLVSARWEGAYLVVGDTTGGQMKIRIIQGRLVA